MRFGTLSKKACRPAVLAVIAALVLVTGASAGGGDQDPSFDLDGLVVTAIRDSDVALGVAIQTDNKIVAAGYSMTGGHADFSLARYNTDGSLDPGFDYDGKVVTDIQGKENYGNAVALQSNGKIVVAGTTEAGGDITVVRYNTDGSLDGGFDFDGIVVTDIGGQDDAHAVAIQPDGKIVVAGYTTKWGEMDYVLVRYNTDGSEDRSFDGDGRVITDIRDADGARGLAIQSDGKIVAAGYSGTGGAYDFSLARYNTNGSLDTSFDIDGKVVTDIQVRDNYGHAIALQSNGKIVVGGYTWGATTGYDFTLTRYNINGSLDTSFDGDGIVVTDIGGDEEVNAVAIQDNGKILAAGYSTNYWEPDFALARYYTNGLLDETFDYDGKVVTTIGVNDFGYGMALQADGKIVLAGKTDEHYSLARYLSGESITYTMNFTSTGTQDGWILESGEFTEKGGSRNATSTTFRLGDDGGDRQYRALLSFNTAALPDSASILAARLFIRKQGLAGVNPFKTHGSLVVDIRKPYFGSGFLLESRDFQAAANQAIAAVFLKTPLTNNWYQADLKPGAYTYINRSGRTQLRLRFGKGDNDDLGADYLSFFSGNYPLTSYRPMLSVDYIIP